MEKLAFSTGAFYTYKTADAVRMIHNAGFQNIELMPQCHKDLTIETLKDVEKIGVHIASIHYPLCFFPILYNANPDMYEESKCFSDNLAAFAYEAGTQFVVIHPEADYKDKGGDIVAKPIRRNIEYLASALEKKGIAIVMENHPTGAGSSPDTLEKYVRSMGIANMRIMVDITEVAEGGKDPIKFINALKETPAHLHLSDYNEKSKHLPPGMGSFDWKVIIKQLKERSYKGFYTLEPSYIYYMVDAEKQLRRDYEFIASML